MRCKFQLNFCYIIVEYQLTEANQAANFLNQQHQKSLLITLYLFALIFRYYYFTYRTLSKPRESHTQNPVSTDLNFYQSVCRFPGFKIESFIFFVLQLICIYSVHRDEHTNSFRRRGNINDKLPQSRQLLSGNVLKWLNKWPKESSKGKVGKMRVQCTFNKRE